MTTIQHVLAIVAIGFSLLVYVCLALAALVLGPAESPLGNSATTVPDPEDEHPASAAPLGGSSEVSAA